MMPMIHGAGPCVANRIDGVTTATIARGQPNRRRHDDVGAKQLHLLTEQHRSTIVV